MIEFSKLQGAGNDFIIINKPNDDMINPTELAMKMCNRHFGIGADGLMVVNSSDFADIKMQYFNSDGSKGEMCGNGIRCFSKYVYEKNIVNKNKFTIETLAGIKTVELDIDEDIVNSVKVDMGKWSFNVKDIPVSLAKDTMILEPIRIGDEIFNISSVRMGVPHAVIIVDEINYDHTIKYGPIIEKMDIFPQNINVNFVQIVDRSHIKVDTWERGAGKTLACGTGACASVVVANALERIDKSLKVEVMGGDLIISILNDETVLMKGPAKLICDGKFYL